MAALVQARAVFAVLQINIMIKKEISQYLEWKASHAPQAAVSYRVHLERFGQFVEGKILEKISTEDVVRFLNLQKIKHSMAGVAYSSIVLKNFFEYFLRQKRNVLDSWLIKIPKYDHRPRPALQAEDFEKMLAQTREDEFWELEKKLILKMLWDTGMRISELASLDVSNIDSRNRMSQVMTRKNRQLRWIMWSEDTHQLLLKYLGVRICLNQYPPLFIAHEMGQGRRVRITTRTMQRWIKEKAKKAGVKAIITPHSFRHAKAHRILDMGGNAVEVGKILGHSDTNPVAAFRYLRLNTAEFTKVAAKFL